MSIIDAVLAVDSLLASSVPAHAFGGALALGYYAEPRATVDIDVNVFVVLDDQDGVLAAFGTLGYRPEQDEGGRSPASGIRLRRDVDPYPVDLFLSLDPLYEEIAARRVRFPFGPEAVPLPFLSAEDLVVFKLSFGRDKDWVDLRRICATGLTLDADYVERQLVALRGAPMYPRLARLRSMLD